MASEKQLARASSLGPSARRPIPTRTSSTRRPDYSAPLDSAITGAIVTPPPIPQRSPRSIAASQKLVANDGRQLDLLKSTTLTNTQATKVLQTSESCPTKENRRSSSCPAAARNSMSSVTVQRWGGLTRTVSDWDGLRRDPELWYEDGDCYVHLHGRGASRRGPSFCIPFRVLRQKKCNDMLDQCDAHMISSMEPAPQRIQRMPSTLKNRNHGSSTVELYIPAPDAASREEAFKWHITTRNFFAFLLGKPLVGEHMGQSLVDLQERMCLFRPDANNQQDCLDYAENQGYRDVVECTDYALAMLYYAEHYKMRNVWIDAFAHCVGMNESIVLSPEYGLNSRLTKALISRASKEIDLHLNRVTAALGNFLYDDFSPANLGLTLGARNHLNRFRKLLLDFYTEKFGYWPPPRGASFPKALYKSMYYDFKTLYDYLVDTESTTDISSQKPASGGICVLQNVISFDTKLKFTAQPHPLPLLPSYTPPSKKADSQKALRQLTLAYQHNKTHQLHAMNAALAVATNTLSKDLVNSRIMQAYMHFEREYASDMTQREEKISPVDARKIRWLLIYGTLQYLVSALRAPKEVRDSDTPEYPLCCLVAGQSTFNTEISATTPSIVPLSVPQALNDYLSSPIYSPSMIQPDCHREDYFSTSHTNQRSSAEVTSPVPKTSQPTRSNSMRSFTQLSLSSRSSRRNSLTLKPPQHCAIIVHGYGDGLNETTSNAQVPGKPRPASSVYSEQSIMSILPDGANPDTSWLRSRTPSAPHSRNPSSSVGAAISGSRTLLLESVKIDSPSSVASNSPTAESFGRSDSTSSNGSSVWSEGASATSSKSSAHGDSYIISKASPAEESGLLGGLVSIKSSATEPSRTRSVTRPSVPQSHIHPLLRRPSPQEDFIFDLDIQSLKTPITRVLSSNSADTTIGVALSAPPSPPLTSAPRSPTTRPPPPLRSITVDTIVTPMPTSSTKGRATDVFSALNNPPNEAWEQYKSVMVRHETRSAVCNAETRAQGTTRISSPFRIPSFRSPMKIVTSREQGEKKEKRMSSFWRR